MATIRISINEDIERILESLKGEYPALDYPELFKLGLSELYRKREFETRQAWMARLPSLELSDEEQDSLDEAFAELETGKGKIMTVDEVMAEVLSD